LFIGDVGRPDLAIKSDLTQEDLAGMLYDSLHTKIINLPDDVIVYPAHGAGSACGKNMSKETYDTLGNQKKTNYAFKLSRKEFVKELTTGILPAPQYFAKNAQLNKSGYDSYDVVAEKGTKSLSPTEVYNLLSSTNAIILDVRKPGEFAKEHIPGSIFIGIDGQFAPWVGALITDLKQPIILVVPAGREKEAVTRLSRVGYDNCVGFLNGGLESWKKEGNQTASITSISASEFAEKLSTGTLNILDVRKPGEYDASHLCEVESMPLDFIKNWESNLSKEKEYHIHCAGGYRSMIAASLLKRQGYSKLVDIAGGYNAIQKTDAKTTEFVCPSTLSKNS
jgi:rhodanese-related sulfurtransferase